MASPTAPQGAHSTQLPQAPRSRRCTRQSPIKGLSAGQPTKTPYAWPLLVQSPGKVPGAPLFFTQCRECGWTSPRQETPGAAWAAFEAHSCQERTT